MTFEELTWLIYGRRPLMQANPLGALQKAESETKTAKTRSGIKQATVGFDVARALLYEVPGENGEPARFGHPSQAFWSVMVAACPGVTIGGKAASGFFPRCVEMVEEYCTLYDPESLTDGKPRPLTEKQWLVDTRMVWNPKVGNVLVSRPKWKEWATLLKLLIDRDRIPAQFTDVVTYILNEAGQMGIGCGSLRKKAAKWSGIAYGKFIAVLKE